MKENNQHTFWFGGLFIIALFFVWPAIVTAGAAYTIPEESQDNGATLGQYTIYSQIYTCLGTLFSGLAFLGTYLLLKNANLQTDYAKQQLETQKKQSKKQLKAQEKQAKMQLKAQEEQLKLQLEAQKEQLNLQLEAEEKQSNLQLEAQKRNFEEELRSSIFRTYRNMIATVHQYHVRIDNTFDKGAVAQHFSKLIQLLYLNNNQEQITQCECFFFEMKKQWHAVCCLYKNTFDMIMRDTKLNIHEKSTLFQFLHAPFSPLDEISMALFYYASIQLDIFNYPPLKNETFNAYIWKEYSSFENFAKPRIKRIAEDLLNFPVKEDEVEDIYSKLCKTIRTQNTYPTKPGTVSTW